MAKTEIKKLIAIAKKNYLIPDDREDLKQKYSDSLDFMDCAVWNIEAVLKADGYKNIKMEALGVR